MFHYIYLTDAHISNFRSFKTKSSEFIRNFPADISESVENGRTDSDGLPFKTVCVDEKRQN